jgi:DNA polymerase-1
MHNRYKELLKEVSKEHSETKDESLNDRVLIIDGLNQFIRVFGAVPALNDDGEHCGGVTGFLLSTAATIRNLKPTRVVIVFDGKGGSNRRKSMYKGYKEGRTGLTKINRLAGYEDLEDQQESMRNQFTRLIEYLQVLPISLTYIDYVEADDIIAYLANHYFKKEVTIISSDKDFLQLVNPRIKVWAPTKKKMYDEVLVKEEYGVKPQNLVFYRVIEGDKSDNIEGVRGIGPKTILNKMTFLNEEVLDLDTFIDKIKTECDDKLSQKLTENVTTIEMNYRLMQLKDPEISSSITSQVRNIMSDLQPELDMVEFKKMFMYDKLYTAFANVDSWLRNSFISLDNNLKNHFKDFDFNDK